MDEHPINKFDPLLRNMLAWGLVEQGPDGDWALRREAADRLNHLSDITRRPEASATVYFGHLCAVCHSNGATRIYEGRHLCDTCRRKAGGVAAAPEPVAVNPERRGPVVRRRARDLAS